MAEPNSTLKTFWMLTRYGFVGIINTTVGITIMVGLAYAGLHYAAYTTIGYFLAFCTSYVLNGIFTFRTKNLSSGRFMLFVTVNSGLLLVTEALQFILIDLIRIAEITGVGCGLVFYTLIGFFLNRHIVYRITPHSS